jgi:anti-anti-sigma factor
MDITTDGATLVLTGDFDVRCTLEVRSALYDHLAGTEGDLVLVDLAGVPAVDLTALRVLAVATRHAEQQGRHLTLRNATPAVRRMLLLSRMRGRVDLEREAATA